MPSSYISDHFKEHQRVAEASLATLDAPIADAAGALVSALRAGNKLLCFGNGGSATQASHMAGELVGRFLATRVALPAIALGSDPGSVTCIANDFGYESLFERQMEALARPGDVALGITTSGSSENVLRGLEAAKRHGAVTIALCGSKGLARSKADYLIRVPSESTAHVQEIHLMVLHALCVAVETAFPPTEESR